MIAPLVEGRSIRLQGDEITWAGECPWNGGFCFGTENGELLICDEHYDRLDVHQHKVSEEAINGVAFQKGIVGVSTRSQVIVSRRISPDDSISEVVKADRGAHGIVATPGGRFFAPMGVAGLLVVAPDGIPEERLAVEKPSQGIINFYKLIDLRSDSPVDLFACASRTSGLVLIRSDRDTPLEIVGWASPDMDFIDVCAVPSPGFPYAMIGIGLDRTLVFVGDPWNEERPQSLRLGELRGTPYSIFSVDGHVFVLTNKELVAYPDLLRCFLDRQRWDRPFRYGYTPIQAVDAYVAYARLLMVVMDAEVRFFEIPDLVQLTGGPAAWVVGEQLPSRVQQSWNSLSLSA